MEILMPKVGLTMTEGSIVQWHKRAGDIVQKGELIFTFETEKSTLEFESPFEGVLASILVPVGQVTPCFVPVAVIGAPQAISNLQSPISSPRARLRAREKGIDINAVNGSGPDGVVLERDVLAFKPQRASARATPVAERMAAEMGIDLATIHGTGRDGLITKEDIEAQRAESLEIGDSTPIQTLTPARRITAQRTTDSARSAPHVTVTTEADATALVSAREQLNAELNEKVSYNALLIAIVARALREHPQLNAYWADGSVAHYQSINIGVAVDTPHGLYVPVVRDATRPLIQVHRELSGLLARTLAGNNTGDDFAAGTFTITNLGMYEIDAFTPIINQPQAAILGVGRILGKPVARGEQVVIRQMMTLSLSFDHRIVDGAPAAKFLQRVKALIERPFALLV
jgi:pyruvate dehydrogenase E2 component (dihydrolipoamide acetyltransferase)